MPYLKVKDLALAYFPEDKPKTAQQKLAGWMRVDLLRRKLELLGWKPYQKVLTPKQVACIIDHVGEPENDFININTKDYVSNRNRQKHREPDVLLFQGS